MRQRRVTRRVTALEISQQEADLASPLPDDCRRSTNTSVAAVTLALRRERPFLPARQHHQGLGPVLQIGRLGVGAKDAA